MRIMGFDWLISINEHVSNEGQVFGTTHTRSQQIFLDPGTTKQKNEQTLIHEILHAISWQTGLTKRLNDPKLEEEMVSSLSFALYQVLIDNKMLK